MTARVIQFPDPDFALEPFYPPGVVLQPLTDADEHWLRSRPEAEGRPWIEGREREALGLHPDGAVGFVDGARRDGLRIVAHTQTAS